MDQQDLQKCHSTVTKEVTLNQDQENALDSVLDFLEKPKEKFMIIQGSAGTGKSTLIKYIARALEAQYQMYSLLLQKAPDKEKFEVALSATTNKAVSVLKELTNMDAVTIHSLLDLKVAPNYTTGETDLIKKPDYSVKWNKLVIVDEASMISDELFGFLDRTLKDSKIILIGDQYQLAPVKQEVSIMESMTCRKVSMNKIMRHAGEILHTSAQFRESVETGIFKNIPVGVAVNLVNGPTFQKLIDAAFTAPDYNRDSAKILCWKNERVLEYNKHVRKIKGYPENFGEGEIVQTNNPILAKTEMIPVDSLLTITGMSNLHNQKSIPGYTVELNDSIRAFMPQSDQQRKQLLKTYAGEKAWQKFYGIKTNWLDLRASYASTVHKSQGSSYKTVFIDLQDIGECFISSDVARMLYVSISRAVKQVYLYGQLPPRYRGA